MIGFLKGKSAVRIHRELMSARRVKGMHFWSRGDCVSTVGLDERPVREYIRRPGGHPNSPSCGHLKIPHLVSSRLVPS